VQGIAGRGAGEYEREKARLERLVMEAGGRDAVEGSVPMDLAAGVWTGPIPAAADRPSKVFEVDSRERWNPSGFAVQPGEAYKVTVAATETWRDSVEQTDSAEVVTTTMGYDSQWSAAKKCYEAEGQCRSYLRQKLRYANANWMHLVCGVGNFVTLLQEAAGGHDRFLPVKEEELLEGLFGVDLEYTFTAAPGQAGELVCFANDADGLAYDNDGAVTVTVERTSWPPSAAFDERYVMYLYEGLVNPSKFDAV